MKILVTGGCGFIGSNFIRYILNKYESYEIINLDALTYAGNPNNVLDLQNNNRYKFIHDTIENKELAYNLMKNVDVCINFAAESQVDNSIANADPFINSNIVGTYNLIEQARKTKLARYIQISTDEVYGSLGSQGLFSESTPLNPNSPYSASKAAADMLVRSYIKTHKLPALITRCSNNYGPYQKHYENFIPLVITNLLEDKKVPLYGDGLNIRDWLYVEDHCRAIDLVLHKGKEGEIYNIGGNTEKTNLEVVKIILEHLKKDDSMISYIKDRPGHDRRYAINNHKIVSELGFSVSMTFEEGILKTIDWYKNNKHLLKQKNIN